MESTPSQSNEAFPPTQWSRVAIAAGNDVEVSRRALNELCGNYWRPVYSFVRHLGYPPQDAEDLTQSYFADLVSRSYLRKADRSKGRFRTFLIRDLKFHLSNEAEKARALKRGGRVSVVPLDPERAERLHDSSTAATSDPDAWFDRQWAFETVRLAKAVVAAEYRAKGRESLFALLKRGLTSTSDSFDYSAWGESLGMSEGAVKVAMHRLRDRFRIALREQVLQTVASEEELKAEMEYLVRALARGGGE